MKSEIWKAMFDGQYEVSSLGNLKRGHSRCGTWKGRPIKPKPDTYGYLTVSISAYDKILTFRVHHLVTWAFLGPRPFRMQVNHKDGIKTNNHISNLEYVTPLANTRHAVALGLHPRGERHGRSKLTEHDVAEIKAVGLLERPNTEGLAKYYRVAPTTIKSVLSGRTWKHIEPANHVRPAPEGKS